MADPKGFLTTPRETPARRPVDVRIRDWREVYTDFPPVALEGSLYRAWLATESGPMKFASGYVASVYLV